ncbi:hypothetical protein M2156_002948 [Streptomyces sp. SAI-149]|nr:hypothetical protein [Streptomyces sp. SAI-149]
MAVSPIVVLVDRDDSGLFHEVGLVGPVGVDAGQRVVAIARDLGVLLGRVALGGLDIELDGVVLLLEGLRVGEGFGVGGGRRSWWAPFLERP